jgi:hypothetical protein
MGFVEGGGTTVLGRPGKGGGPVSGAGGGAAAAAFAGVGSTRTTGGVRGKSDAAERLPNMD